MKKTIEISDDLSKLLINPDVEWSLYLFKKRYKNKELYYEMYEVVISDLAIAYSDIYKNMNANYLNKKDLKDYAPDMPKDTIGFIDLNETSLIDLSQINLGIEKANPFRGELLKYSGYIIEGKLAGETCIKIFFASNTVRTYRKRYFWTTNEFAKIEKPMLEIKDYADCIICNDYCLFFSNRAEGIFDLEKHYKAVAQKSLKFIHDLSIIENFPMFSDYASNYRQALKFDSFDEERLLEFSKLSVDDKKEVIPSNLEINNKGQFITANKEQLDAALDFICLKVFKDFNNDFYQTSYPKKIT